MRPYERDPKAIYAASFATVRHEANLDRFPADVAELAVRVIHACGMIEVADRLAYAPDVAASGIAAIRAGAPVYADCEMVASGITRRLLPEGTEIRCTLNDPRVPDMAAEGATTRSAAAVDLWDTGGAVVAIGNAPTALFRLLERLDEGAPRPAAILAFPVGFVGAAESKAELAERPRATPFLTLRGRRGGSAMASAAVNALGILAAGGVQ
ncbi:precorrin-8X methylmutase [Jannaschia sp. KMU-145]|uniref:precorrin-8X methylmutase n=1 Tax=Jannaschia halovivens TaxID=3388667 RepID=UPI00396B38F1